MSAFICSDKHIATIAYNIGSFCDMGESEVQVLANKLKHINIASVNYRYNEKTRKAKCNIDARMTIENRHDIAGLIGCWIYQSCEDACNIDYHAYKALLENYVEFNKLNSNNSSVWSV